MHLGRGLLIGLQWTEKERLWPGDAHVLGRTKGQLKSFVESRLVAVRTNGLETALGNFRSVRP
jgi:hypothetical protein